MKWPDTSKDALQDIVIPGSITRTPVTAVAECITLEQAKSYLHIGYDDDNDLITALITEAREWIEEQTGRAIIKQDITCRVELYHSLEIPFGPLYPATAVVATPVSNTTILTMSPGPFTRLEGRGIYDLAYTSGQDTDKVAEGLKQAILARIAATYENRGDQDKTNYAQIAFDRLAPFKRIVAWL